MSVDTFSWWLVHTLSCHLFAPLYLMRCKYGAIRSLYERPTKSEVRGSNPTRTTTLCQQSYASTVSTHIDRVALQFIYWPHRRNGDVGLENDKQKLLVLIGKVVAQSKSVSHMVRKWDPKLRLAWVLDPGKMSLVTALFFRIWKCKLLIETIGGSRADTEPTAWCLDAPDWNL